MLLKVRTMWLNPNPESLFSVSIRVGTQTYVRERKDQLGPLKTNVFSPVLNQGVPQNMAFLLPQPQLRATNTNSQNLPGSEAGRQHVGF